MIATVETKKTHVNELIGCEFEYRDGDILRIKSINQNSARLIKFKEGGKQVFVHECDMPSITLDTAFVIGKFGYKFECPKLSDPLPEGILGVEFSGYVLSPLEGLGDRQDPKMVFGEKVKNDSWILSRTLHRPLVKTDSRGNRTELVPPWGDLAHYRLLLVQAKHSIERLDPRFGIEFKRCWLDENYLLKMGWAVLPID